MANANLLEISYQRVASSSQVTLTPSNCEQYGYSYTKKTINEVEYTIYYEKDKDSETYIRDSDGKPTNVVTIYTYNTYTHIAPPCSNYQINYADVDKEGSGRNSLTGEMFRERIGNYRSIDVTWDLIPNTKEYNNWYKVLTHLPPSFKVKSLMPNGEIEEHEYYRTDVSTKLYVFVANAQIWQGLSTTFVQFNVDEYDDTLEPTLEV